MRQVEEMEPTVWEVIFVSCNIISALFLRRAIIKIGRIRIKPVQGLIIQCYGESAALLVIITMYGFFVKPPAWQFLIDVHRITAVAPMVFFIMCVINKCLDRHMENLPVAVKKLRQVELTLHRLDPLQSSEQFMGWLKSVDNLQRRVEVIEAGYYGSSMDMFLGKFRKEANQELNRVNDLLRQGRNLLHPEKYLWGTMNFYIKKVVHFIEDVDAESGLLGIWGMGGVGKSSLLKLVCDSHSEHKGDSFEVLFVRAGIGCTLGQVQVAIATSLELRLEHNETSQAKIIQDHLIDKSFLLLLDDLWGYLDLKAVGIPSPLGMLNVSLHGGLERQIWRKVVLTTRKLDLCHEMGCHLDYTIQMECFSEEDAWRIYDRRLKGNILGPKNLYPYFVDTQGYRLPPQKPPGRNANHRLLQGKPSDQVVVKEKPSGHVVTEKSLPEEPSGEVDVIQEEKLLPKELSDGDKLLVEKLSDRDKLLLEAGPSSSSRAITNYTWFEPPSMDVYKMVCDFIEAPGPSLMAVSGMRGVGKTAVLRLVRDTYTAKSCFDHIMFVGAGTGCMVNNVQHAIAINLGLDWVMMSTLDELSRATHISNYLQDKTFLVLLDDIREPFNWWSIGLPTLSSQRRIIFAARSRAAAALMYCDPSNNIEIRCLQRDDAWNLFKKKVGLKIIDDQPQVRHLAEQMVSQCGGLPLALCALGRAMSNKRDSREWRNAYSQLTAMRLQPHTIDDNVGSLILNPHLAPRATDENVAIILPEHNTESCHIM